MSKPHELLQFFAYAHLPPHLQAVSKPFCDVAGHIGDCPEWVCEPHVGDAVAELAAKVEALPDNCERSEALKKLRGMRSFVSGYGTAAGGLGKGNALRMLLEAKDCAVRALLYKP